MSTGSGGIAFALFKYVQLLKYEAKEEGKVFEAELEHNRRPRR